MGLMEYREPNQVKWVGVRPGHYGEQVLESNVQSNIGTTILYTVPAGKTLFLTALHWSFFAAGPTNMLIQIFDNVPGLWCNLMPTTITNNSGNIGAIPYYYPVEIPSGYSIRLNVNLNGSRLESTIHGWIE